MGLILKFTAIIVVFSICMGEYLIRYHHNAPLSGRVVIEDKSSDSEDENARGELTTNLKIMLLVLIFSTTLLFIR